MKLYVTLFILGLPYAGLFCLLGTGVVMIYRASKILTLAQGAIAMFTAYILYQLNHTPDGPGTHGFGIPLPIALPLALAFAGLMGYVIERFLLRPLRDRAVLVSVIMSVGILSGLTGLAGIIWSYDRQDAPRLTPLGAWHPFGITIGKDQLTIIAMAIAVMLAVIYLFKRTTLGVAMRAVADDRRAALLMGIPADRVSSLTWIIGTVLAGVAGILLTPALVQLQPLQLVLISIPAYAAVLFGGLSNLVRMTIGAILVGVFFSEVPSLPGIKSHNFPGTPELAIFLAVIVFMFVTGKSIQLQEEEI